MLGIVHTLTALLIKLCMMCLLLVSVMGLLDRKSAEPMELQPRLARSSLLRLPLTLPFWNSMPWIPLFHSTSPSKTDLTSFTAHSERDRTPSPAAINHPLTGLG